MLIKRKFKDSIYIHTRVLKNANNVMPGKLLCLNKFIPLIKNWFLHLNFSEVNRICLRKSEKMTESPDFLKIVSHKNLRNPVVTCGREHCP